MNGLSYLYNALNNRQARIERDEREAQRILEQEKQRKQRAAANKHAGMMNTLNLIGTVGGAIAGAPGGPGAAMAGASLGSALASGITGVAPNVMGTQPSADNPYYDAPSDSQRALSAINAGLQVASAYETNLKAKQDQKIKNDLMGFQQTHRNDPSYVEKMFTPDPKTGDAPVLAKLGYTKESMPWYSSWDDVRTIQLSTAETYFNQLAPAAELAKAQGRDLQLSLIDALGSDATLQLTDKILLLKRKGNTAAIQEVIAQVDDPRSKELLASYAKLPEIAMLEGRKTGFDAQGTTSSQRKSLRADNASTAERNAMADAENVIERVDKITGQLQTGGSQMDMLQNIQGVNQKLKAAGLSQITPDGGVVTPEQWLFIAGQQSYHPEVAKIAASRRWGQEAALEAYQNLAANTNLSRELQARYQAFAVQMSQDPNAGAKTFKWIESAKAETGTSETSETPAPSIGGAKPPMLSSPDELREGPISTASLSPVERVEARYSLDQNRPAQATTDEGTPTDFPANPPTSATTIQLEEPVATSSAPRPTATAPTNLGSLYPAPDADPIVAMAPRFEGQPTFDGGAPTPLRTEQQALNEMNRTRISLADAEANPLPRRAIGEDPQTGRPIWQDPNSGEVYSAKEETFQVDTGWVNVPTVDANTGNDIPRDVLLEHIERRDFVNSNSGGFFEIVTDPSTGRRLPIFPTQEQAVEASKRNSQRLGELLPEMFGQNVQPSPFPDNLDRARTPADQEAYLNRLAQTAGMTDEQVAQRLAALKGEPNRTNLDLMQVAGGGLVDRNAIVNSLPSSDELRQLPAKEPQILDNRTASQRVDDDIANAPIQRAAGPDMRRLEAEQENINRQQGEELERGFEAYLRNRRNQMAQQAREQQQLANEKATPIVDERLNRPPVSPAQDDISDRGTLYDVSGLKDKFYSRGEGDQQVLEKAIERAAQRKESRVEPSKPQAMLEKALKTEGLEGMTPVIRDMIQLESSGNPEARNQMGSNAFGLLQLTDDTFERYAPKGAKRGDQKAEIAAAVALLKDNKTYLENNEVTPNFVNLYIVHHFGKGGLNLLKADPDDLITEVTYRNSNTGERERLITAAIIAQNPWLSPSMTVSEMLEKVRDARERGQFGSTGGAA